MLAVVTLPHGQVTTLAGEATLSRGLSHHRITLVARLGRALVAEHQAESSFRVQQLLMRLRVAARPQTTTPSPPLPGALAFRWGLPYLLPTRLGIPQEASRVRYVGLKQNAVGGALLAAPSALCGFPVVYRGGQVDLYSRLQYV